MEDLVKLDLYGVLDVSHEATEKEIVKAYRKAALKCHPDKNPDNPSAVEKFHQLSKALEILTDEAARAAYDKVLKAKKAAELRQKVFDSKRKKFKDDLDAREKAAAEGKTQQNVPKATDEEKLKKEIERLRKEGSSLLKQEQERLKEELNTPPEKENHPQESAPAVRLKIKWKSKKGDETNGGYDQDCLKNIFSQYGEVTALLVSSKKNGSAIIEFTSADSGVRAVLSEKGKSSNPLTLNWLSGEPTSMPTSMTPMSSDLSFTASGSGSSSAPSFSVPSCSSERDYENIVLMKLRQAEERKRLIAEMKADEEKDEKT